MNDTLRSILDRRSTRGFAPDELTQEQLQELMDAALASPSACNYQDWQFIFVRNRALLREFSLEYKEGMLKQLEAMPEERRRNLDYDLFFGAPLFVIISLPEQPQSRFAQVDAGIAVENLALAAHGMGLGSVILGRPKDVFASPSGADWERRFGFPDGHHFAIGIVIGKPTTGKPAHPIRDGKLTLID